jgi:hypothetical protein
MNLNGATIGLAFGIALGFAGAFGGIVAFVIVLVVGFAGLVGGRIYDGELDVSNYLGGLSRRQQHEPR